jgi:hypothetical protein
VRSKGNRKPEEEEEDESEDEGFEMEGGNARNQPGGGEA